ncbi:hypothetical protein [Shinella sp. JR1-6]|uniref:sunset domain-containing protein n=1 Tax=Shinella sp. JR1-6 TaxID=2527671 RepID=UPI00102D46CA|nr:hypothetical protein [Shinella sp. JR1-6]TAA53916.1 hypothetical protein EXZ48_28100 [Shinella sp. JR1-6]
MSNFTLLVAAASAVTFIATGGYALMPRHWYDPACNIKGNISINSGERIYHVSGQQDYLATKISPQYGEQWFCSEEDARAAGWRKAGR